MMTRDRLLQVMEHLAFHARKTVPKRELMPLFAWDDADGEHHVIGTPWDNDSAKLVVMAMVKDMLRDCGATGYAFAFESWVSRDKSFDRPSDDPNRTECVVVCGSLADGTRIVHTYEVEDRRGRRRLGKMQVAEDMLWVTPFADLLDKPSTKH